MNNPGTLSVIPIKNQSNYDIPRANQTLGVIKINELMLNFAQSEDEMAAVIGHEFLHHTLAHDILVIEMTQSRWFKMPASKEERGAHPLIGESNFLAGFDPWAIIRLNNRLLAALEDAPPVIIDGYTKNKFRKRTAKIEKYLKNQNTGRTGHQVSQT